MTLVHHNVKKLEEMNNLLMQISSEFYSRPLEILSGSSIGQHFRHIFEFYTSLEDGVGTGTVCYDDRERNPLLETDVDQARAAIGRLIHFIQALERDQALTMKADYSTRNQEPALIQTSVYREMAYALDIRYITLPLSRLRYRNKRKK